MGINIMKFQQANGITGPGNNDGDAEGDKGNVGLNGQRRETRVGNELNQIMEEDEDEDNESEEIKTDSTFRAKEEEERLKEIEEMENNINSSPNDSPNGSPMYDDEEEGESPLPRIDGLS